MVSSLICAALFVFAPFQNQDRQNLLYRVIPHPTGANGYEEYLRAAEIVSDPACGVYDSWLPNMDAPNYDSPSDPRISLIRRLNSMNFLSVRQEQVKRYGEALDVIRQGSLKRIVDPRQPLTPESLLPEVSYFRRLARLFTADAYLKFADGKSAAATRDLVDGLTFSYNIANGSLITALVGISSTSILLAECSDRLGSFSLDDCRALEEISKRLLSAPNPLARAIEGERQMQLYVVNDVFTKHTEALTAMVPTDSKEGKSLLKRVNESTPADRSRWQASLTNIVNGFFDAQQKRFAGPEAKWAGADADLQTWIQQDPDPLVKSFASLLFPIFDQAALSAARSRTQLRLLYLNALVMEFRWLNNRFPNRLSELGPNTPVKDPLSGEDFGYELRGGGYRLFSKGVEGTGEIEMRYRRPISQDQDPNP